MSNIKYTEQRTSDGLLTECQIELWGIWDHKKQHLLGGKTPAYKITETTMFPRFFNRKAYAESTLQYLIAAQPEENLARWEVVDLTCNIKFLRTELDRELSKHFQKDQIFDKLSPEERKLIGLA